SNEMCVSKADHAVYKPITSSIIRVEVSSIIPFYRRNGEIAPIKQENFRLWDIIEYLVHRLAPISPLFVQGKGLVNYTCTITSLLITTELPPNCTRATIQRS